jgi:rhamnosyltransferase subunit B
MGTILILTNGTEGDVRPLLHAGAALRERGHAVTLLTHCAYAERGRQIGLEFAPIDTPDEYERELDDTHIINDPPGIKTYVQRHILPKIQRICELVRLHHRPGQTVLLSHYQSLLFAQIAAEYVQLPLALLCGAPSQITTLPLIERVIESNVGEQINQIRAEIGLPAVQDWPAAMHLPKPSMGQWPEWFGAPEASWPWQVTPVGWLLFAESEPKALPPEVQALIDPQARPILITGGTGSFVEQDFFAAGIAACQLLGRPGILVARRPKFLPSVLPQSISWFPSLPFATVMPQMAAVIHHGGMGTSGQSVAAGVPQVVLAIGADRPDNGARLQELGVAECLLRPHWRGETVAAALRRLIESPSVRERCQELARRCRVLDPTTAVCHMIEQLLQAPVPFRVPASIFRAPGNTHTRPAEPDPARSDLQQRAEMLSPQRRALLARLLQKQGARRSLE